MLLPLLLLLLPALLPLKPRSFGADELNNPKLNPCVVVGGATPAPMDDAPVVVEVFWLKNPTEGGGGLRVGVVRVGLNGEAKLLVVVESVGKGAEERVGLNNEEPELVETATEPKPVKGVLSC